MASIPLTPRVSRAPADALPVADRAALANAAEVLRKEALAVVLHAMHAGAGDPPRFVVVPEHVHFALFGCLGGLDPLPKVNGTQVIPDGELVMVDDLGAVSDPTDDLEVDDDA